MICLRGVQLIQRVLMFILWMCGLGFAQEENNELGLLLGAEFIPEATTPSNQNLSFGRSTAYSVEYARRLSSGNMRRGSGLLHLKDAQLWRPG